MSQLSNPIKNLYGYSVQYVKEEKEYSKKSGIDIYQSALNRLYDDLFVIEQDGSKYLAKLIEALYHERALLLQFARDPSFARYWDLKDINNPHYIELGDAQQIIDEMRKSIIDSRCEKNDADLNELIYDLADREIIKYNYLYKDDEEHAAKNAISYKKLLPGYYEEPKRALYF